jgi:hypothetical protein
MSHRQQQQHQQQQRIVLVGHCGFDAPRIEREVARHCPKLDILNINDEEELEELCCDDAALLLINRQLPFGFEEEHGVDLMRDLHRRYPHLKMMLVSDRPDAQEEAKRLGAAPGFGKADLGSDRVAEALKRALASQRPC